VEPLLLLGAVLLFSLLGTAAGVATGLTPGLHVNTVAAVVLASQALLVSLTAGLLAWASPSTDDLLLIVAALIIGNVVSHTFLDYIPTIFLGAPEGETALSVLPGHRMLLQGRGLDAVRLSARGSMVAALLSLLLILPFRLVMGSPVNAYEDLRPYIHLLLVLVAALFIVAERGTAATRTELVCDLPEGFLHEGEETPPVEVLSPSEVAGRADAFLLRGRIVRWTDTLATLEDDVGRIDVRLSGRLDTPPVGEVSLFVAPDARIAPYGPLMQRGWALLTFLLAGALGYLVLSTPLMTRNVYPLGPLGPGIDAVSFLPLFTGLFGLPTLLISLARSPRIPRQDRDQSSSGLNRSSVTRATVGGSLAGALVAWIPGVTAAAATVLSQLFSGRRRDGEGSDEEFILSISCVNTSAAIFTILALFVLLRARSGGMAAVQSIAGPLIVEWEPLMSVPGPLLLFLVAAMVSAGVSFYLTGVLGGLFASLIIRVPYRSLAAAIIASLLTAILLLAGLVGLAVAGIATSIGLLPPLLRVRRIHLMGSLILPLILALA
jgi:putative membrane protein